MWRDSVLFLHFGILYQIQNASARAFGIPPVRGYFVDLSTTAQMQQSLQTFSAVSIMSMMV